MARRGGEAQQQQAAVGGPSSGDGMGVHDHGAGVGVHGCHYVPVGGEARAAALPDAGIPREPSIDVTGGARE